MSQVNSNRAGLLADLIRNARLQAGRSAEDCAQVLGITSEEFAGIEAGEWPISLPGLEVLAMEFGLPMTYFWGDIETSPESAAPDYDLYSSLRQRIIGVALRRARLETGQSLTEAAADLELDSEQLAAYEDGRDPIPYLLLEQFANYYGISVQLFTEEDYGPLARHEAKLRLERRFDQLPPEVKAFVVEPINLSYLETAIRLSEMDVDKLRKIAEGILDITF